MVKVVAVADLHGGLPEIPPCDLLLIAGDINGTSNVPEQERWLDGPFREWLDRSPAAEVVAVAGNHDWIFQLEPGRVPKLRWHYLQDSGVNLFGLSIWGSPWQPWFGGWAFNAGEPRLAERFSLIPDDADVVVTHGPPQGLGDLTRDGQHVGSESLKYRLLEVMPKLSVFGHIHSGRGTRQVGRSTFANVALVDERYQQVWPPVEFEVETP